MSQRDAFRGGERMIARRWVLGLMAGSAAALVSGCGLMNDRASYRFRMTVEVETPNGLRIGSSVYEFIAAKNTMKLLAEEVSGGVLTRGEATIIDLDGGPVFVTLKTPVAGVDLGGEATDAFLTTLPDGGGDDFIAAINKLGGWFADPVSAELPREKWPLMVRFGDLNDPTSVKRVDPESLGVKRILLETTHDDVTVGLQDRLQWLQNGGLSLDPGGSPTTSPTFAQTIYQSAFTSEIKR